jgi:CDP-4-dehydro-6-deoxyglucose reductase, E3
MADGNLGAAPIPARDEAPYRVIAIEHRTRAIVEVWLQPMDQPMDYRPGEYVLLEDSMRQIPPRSYSIANAPRPDGLVSLLITRVADGTTSVWVHDQLRRGDEVTVTGPYGTFVADPASTAPCLYLAAGSGLAPIRALIEAGLEAMPQRPLTLIFSARTEADVLDRERFSLWQTRYPHFRFIRTLTRGPGPAPRGRVPHVLGTLCSGVERCEVFVAGAPGFVGACALAAEAHGARREHVRTEQFFAGP